MSETLEIYLGTGKITRESCDGGCLNVAGDQYHLIYQPDGHLFHIKYNAVVAQIGSWEDRWPVNEAEDHIPADIWQEALSQIEKINNERDGDAG